MHRNLSVGEMLEKEWYSKALQDLLTETSKFQSCVQLKLLKSRSLNFELIFVCLHRLIRIL